MPISILSRMKSIFNIDEASKNLYRKNFFSQEFLLDTLQGVGFQLVEVSAPTEEGAIHLGAKLFDERGNSFIISVHHLGNVLNLSAHPNDADEIKTPRSANRISMTGIYLPKYIKVEKKEGLVFGNETSTSLLRECKRKTNLFFDELKDEFERRRGFATK